MLQLLLAGVLAAPVVLSLEAGPPPEETAVRLAEVDLEHATEVLAAERAILDEELTAALWPEYQSQVAGLAGLQAQGAELVLNDLVWRVLPAQGVLVPVELELTVTGQYYDLPILVDGLYRSAWPVEIKRIEVETPKLNAAGVQATINARFHRPPFIDTTWLEEEGAALFPEEPEAAGEALSEAARLRVLEAFADRTPSLEADSRTNHDLVMMYLPRTLHTLPETPLGWIALTVEGETVEILEEPT